MALSAPSPSLDDVFSSAFATHHQVQGSGSGVDVAASTYGGMLRFTKGQRPTPVAPVDVLVIWSGESAKTGPRVKQYLAWEGREAFAAASADLIARFHDDPVQALRDGRRLLEDMADQAGIAYRTPHLDAICDLAERMGGGAKPSGAGGGDCAVAVFKEATAAEAFRAELAHTGYRVLSTALAPGVHEEGS